MILAALYDLRNMFLPRVKGEFHLKLSYISMQHKNWYIYPEPKIEPKNKVGLDLDPINYFSGSYIFKTNKPKPNWNYTKNRMDT